MRAWLTKNSIPSGRVEYVLSLPDDETWRADFLGALFLLTQPQNWELDQGLIPQEMADEWEKVFYDFNEGVYNLIPIGCYFPYAGSSIPGGWLLCDGQAVSRVTYVALFSVIGVAHGAGNGTTTFNLPNIKGRVVVGRDAAQTEFDTLGESGGSKVHTLVTGEMPAHIHAQDAHNHTQNSHGHTHSPHNHLQDSHSHTIFGAMTAADGTTKRQLALASGNNTTSQDLVATNQAATSTAGNATATNQTTVATNQSTGGGGSHNNLQPYQVGNWIIKY